MGQGAEFAEHDLTAECTVGRGKLRKGFPDKTSALKRALRENLHGIGMKVIVRVRASGATGSANSTDAKA